MGLIQAITEFFQSIFMSSSPEVKKKAELRKIETAIKALPSQIYKNGQLQPNFAELFRVLYESTKPIDDIFAATLRSENAQRAKLFEGELVVTGFSIDTQNKLEELSYESRKNAVIDSELPINRVIESQKHSMDSIIRQLNAPEFSKIDDTISRLRQLADICRYNYVDVIHIFDPGFDGITTSNFSAVHAAPPEKLAQPLMDLYYILGNFVLDNAEARAILALKQLSTGHEPSEEEKQEILQHLRKINSVFSKYLTFDTIKNIICLARGDPSLSFDTATYKSNSLKTFMETFQNKFNSDSERIKGEIKDYTVSFEIKELFGEQVIQELRTYNAEMNETIRNNSPFSFTWITPMQVLKTFMTVFMTEPVMNVINNIVIEGFFNNAEYKTKFSTVVYAVNEIMQNIQNFEHSFEREQKNDSAELTGLIGDSKHDPGFLKKVGEMVDSINEQAHVIVQNSSKALYELYLHVGEFLTDAKKSKSDLISNIKVLLFSTRNKEGSGAIEQQYEKWELFLKIMKNYAIIGDLGKSHE